MIQMRVKLGFNISNYDLKDLKFPFWSYIQSLKYCMMGTEKILNMRLKLQLLVDYQLVGSTIFVIDSSFFIQNVNFSSFWTVSWTEELI